MKPKNRGNLLGKDYPYTRKTQHNTGQAQDILKYNTFINEDTEDKIENDDQSKIKESDSKTINTAKRINMAFSDFVYNRLVQQSSILGVTIAFYLNEMIRNANEDTIQKYYDSLLIKPNKAHVPRRKGAALKRITIKFSPDSYSKMVVNAEKFNQTLTQYANMVIESSIGQA